MQDPYRAPAGGITSQPFAFHPGARAPMRSPNDWYARRPPGRSTLANVLIGLAIAFGTVFVMGILAAIAIPVFLHQRELGQAGAASSSSSHRTTVAMPATALGWVRSDTAESNQFAQQFLDAPFPGTKSVGIYTAPSGARRAAILVGQARLSAADQADYLRGSQDSEAKSGVTRFHAVAPGPLGGTMQCGVLASGGATICNFADGSVVGSITILGTTNGDAQAVQLREAVEHRT